MPRTHALRILLSSATLTLALLSACAAPNAGSSEVSSEDPAPRPAAARATVHDSAANSDPSSNIVEQPSPATRSADAHHQSPESSRAHPSPPIAAPSSNDASANTRVDPPDAHADAPPPPPQNPRQPAIPWVASHESFNTSEDISLTGKWTGNRRLEVHTDNVQRLTLNLHKLPPGAPTKGPWNLQIDRQGIEISGRRGKIVHLMRSPNGVWSVDRDKSPARR